MDLAGSGSFDQVLVPESLQDGEHSGVCTVRQVIGHLSARQRLVHRVPQHVHNLALKLTQSGHNLHLGSA